MNQDCMASAATRLHHCRRAGRDGGFVAGAKTLIGALALMVAACGGGGLDDGAASAAVTAPEAGSAATSSVLVPLFDDAGHPSAAAKAAQPADPAMRTHAGLYASPAQYQWEAQTASPYTVLVDLDESGSVRAALQDAMAVRDWPFAEHSKLAWFVKSSDARAGARLADALTGLGLDQVFLIVAATDGAR